MNISKLFKTIIMTMVFIFAISFGLIAQDRAQDNNDERRFQLGFGAIIGTGSYLDLLDTIRLSESIKNGSTYNYPGLTQQQLDAFRSLSGGQKRAITVANILGSLEYGFQTRFLWNILIGEIDLMLLPFDGSYNGRLDFDVLPSIGLRVPFFIMPYLMVGVPFTFSFYPKEFVSLENWKSRWAATDNFAFRVGLNVRLGLDLKFKSFSIGAYYQYQVKDFDEFTRWRDALVGSGISQNDATSMIVAEQSRLGASICWYLF